MSHTTKLTSGNVAIHDGDYGEDITFVIAGEERIIPTADVMEIVGEMIRDKRMCELENMSTIQLISLDKIP